MFVVSFFRYFRWIRGTENSVYCGVPLPYEVESTCFCGISMHYDVKNPCFPRIYAHTNLKIRMWRFWAFCVCTVKTLVFVAFRCTKRSIVLIFL